jgi:hypothetical protein
VTACENSDSSRASKERLRFLIALVPGLPLVTVFAVVRRLGVLLEFALAFLITSSSNHLKSAFEKPICGEL